MTERKPEKTENQNKGTIVAYKGLDKDFKCRGFQYKVGREYTHTGPVNACESGFHACEHPLNVFEYYPPSASRFAVVKQSGDLSRGAGDTKVASRNIRIKFEIGIADLVRAAVEYVSSRCKPVNANSPASATGDQGAASATGYRGAASATGYQGAASATGDQGAASATGQHAVALAAGESSRAKGREGCALFLVYRNPDSGRILHAKALIVGKRGIKPDTWYRLNAKGKIEIAE